MKLRCVKEMKDFTICKEYKLLGCAGEYVELKADNGRVYTIFEGYFEIVK